MRNFVRLGAVAGATALSLILTACGSSGASSSASSASPSNSSTGASAPVDVQHNAADVSFAQQMIVHHQGAIQMAQMATAKASTQQVKDLAQRIETAQGPEIQEMTSWLKAWGQPVAAGAAMSGMDTGGMSTSSASMGSMGQQEMDQLNAATGKNFDRMFLQMMTAHHQGAIAMAKTEQADGSNPQAKARAGSIETSQTAEVTEMGQMLQSLGA